MRAEERVLAAVVGLQALALGLIYALRAFGPSEAEVAVWGRWSATAGILALAAAAAPDRLFGLSRLAVRRVAAAGFALLALAQGSPAVLWLLFHGSGISDGTPPSWLVAHWTFALPHLALLAGAASLAVLLLRRHFRVSS